MSDTDRTYRIDRRKAEQFLAEHLDSMPGQGSANRAYNRAAVRRFLADLCQIDEGSTSQLILTEARLFDWLVGEARRRSSGNAVRHLGAVSRYLRALTRAALLETDLMAAFQARHGSRGWKVLVPALCSADPGEALAPLRIQPPAGPIEPLARGYLELHQGVGKDYRHNCRILTHLDHFLQAQGVPSVGAVTPELIERWAATTTGNARTRMLKSRIVWRFFEHLHDLKAVSSNPVSAVILGLTRRPGTLFKPFIYTPEQIAAIVEAAGKLPSSPFFPLRGETCSTILALLSALGLRIGEACRLRVRDLSLPDATLFIDRTKFYKSRYVPFGPKLGGRLQRFLDLRRGRQPSLGPDDPLFVALGPAHLDQSVMNYTFRGILKALGIRGMPGQKTLRLHDLRHSFAVNRLLGWYREGADVQSKLPALSTFMGHVDPKSTQVYLTITAALLQEAGSRFYHGFGHLFDEEKER